VREACRRLLGSESGGHRPRPQMGHGAVRRAADRGIVLHQGKAIEIYIYEIAELFRGTTSVYTCSAPRVSIAGPSLAPVLSRRMYARLPLQPPAPVCGLQSDWARPITRAAGARSERATALPARERAVLAATRNGRQETGLDEGRGLIPSACGTSICCARRQVAIGAGKIGACGHPPDPLPHPRVVHASP